MRTFKLIKGWKIGTLSEEVLRQVVGLHIAADVWNELKSMLNKATMDKELTLHHQVEMFRRESCDSLNDYLSKYKTICDELAAIGKPFTEDRKSFLEAEWTWFHLPTVHGHDSSTSTPWVLRSSYPCSIAMKAEFFFLWINSLDSTSCLYCTQRESQASYSQVQFWE